MRIQSTIIGLLSVVMLSISTTSFAAHEIELYTSIRDSVLQRYPELVIEQHAFDYIVALSKLEDEDITEEDVEAILDGTYINDCEEGKCVADAFAIVDQYSKATELREFSQQLQRIAQSYEAGNMGVTGHPNSLSVVWPSITGIWQSGVDQSLAPLPTSLIRYETLDDSYSGSIDDIESILLDLIQASEEPDGVDDTNDFNAAVYRYRHGSQWQINSQDCNEHNSKLVAEINGSFGSKQRFCALEDAMTALYTSIQSYEYNPPLRSSESVIFESRVLHEYDAYIWIRNNEIGLNWVHGLDTAHSTFAYDENVVTASWEYEEPLIEPLPGEGLCSHPLSKRGYLCRPIATESCPVAEENCIKDPETGECFDPSTTSLTGSIVGLTTCEPQNFKEAVRITESGPNVCQYGAWLEQPTEEDGYDDLSVIYHDTDPEENPDIKEEKNECSNCVVDYYCADTCGDMGSDGAFTFFKDDDHVSKICLPNKMDSLDDALIYYLALHETVHAQQTCGQPPGTNIAEDAESCCAIERDAYLVMCNALWEDGILQQTDFSVTECASMWSNNSCESFGENACTVTEVDFSTISDQINGVFEENRDTLKTPQTCAEVVSEPSAKFQSLVASTGPVCNPNCAAKYKNTIGNNLCYIGQCVEQSWEQNRLVPGRATTGVQSQAYPWEACINPDPQLGAVTTTTSVKATRIPVYNPGLIVQNLDIDLCQQNGYPLLTPPVLCMYNQNQQLNLGQSEALSNAGQFEQNMISDAFERSLTINSFSNIGNRIGSEMYTSYLDTAIPTMNEALKTVQSLMKQMGEIELPTTMCPREQIESCSYFTSP